MTELKRAPPHPEWVLMYRQGIPSPAIAAAAGVGRSTVRYHLHIAAKADPSIRDEHRAAAGAPVQPSGAGLQNMEDLIALYKTEGRLPSSKGLARHPGNGHWRCGCIDGGRTPTGAPSPPSTGKA
jgi:hypothetical protein